jgi:hypothetical protein
MLKALDSTTHFFTMLIELRMVAGARRSAAGIDLKLAEFGIHFTKVVQQ